MHDALQNRIELQALSEKKIWAAVVNYIQHRLWYHYQWTGH